MGTASTQGAATATKAVFTLRVDREQLDQLRQIAASEHRTVNQELRRMIEARIADANGAVST